MKKYMNTVFGYVKQYVNWSIKNRFKGFLSIIGLIAFVFLLTFIVTPKLTKGDIPQIEEGYAMPVLEEIELVSNLGLPIGEILAYENDEAEIHLNTETMNVRIKNKESGISWNTTYNLNRDFDKMETYEIEAMSLMSITYFGYDNTSEKWNLFENSVIPGNVVANKIEDGIQLVFDVQDVKSVNLFEFIPQEISKERFESIFITGIENAELSAQDKYGIESSFDYCYRYNPDKDNYYYRLATTPQLAMIDYLIQAVGVVEYTQEDLISDNAEYGIETYFAQKPHFEVVMEFTLEGSELVVNVPTGSIVNHSDYFDIISIEVLPNFSGADYRYKTGYVFVPDGSGAIMDLDSYQDAYPMYSKPVYDNNLYFDIYNEKEYSKDIDMPVFGMTYKKGGTTPMQGYFGIIETGEELSYINAQVSDGYSMNQAFASFDTIQDTYLKVFGPYAIQSNVFRSETEFHSINYQVRYILLEEEDANYYSMSQIYRDYLIEKLELEKIESDNLLHLDVLGSVTVKDRVFGVPYDRVKSFTTFDQLDTILEAINNNVSVTYMGVLNGGVKNDLMNKISFVSQLDNKMSFSELSDKHDDIYIGMYLSRAYSTENGMRNRYAIHDFYGEPVDITQYNTATNQFEDDIITTYYRVVSPRYLEDVVEKYLNKTENTIDNVMIYDLPSDYYADYNRNRYVSPLQSTLIKHNALSLINEKQQIIMSNPMAEYFSYASLITDLPRESSNYGGFTSSVPFTQLVLHDLIPYTTESLNYETSLSNQYYLLQYAELGAIPKFFVSYSNTVDLKVTEYNYYYSIQYETYLDDMANAITYLDEFDNLVPTKSIVDHQVVADRVYLSEYSDGSLVYVNYNDYQVTITFEDDTSLTIDAFDYEIK